MAVTEEAAGDNLTVGMPGATSPPAPEATHVAAASQPPAGTAANRPAVDPVTYRLTVPTGLSAGDQMEIHTADDKAVVVSVPVGVEAGGSFHAAVSAEVLAAAPDVTTAESPKRVTRRVKKPSLRKGTDEYAHAVLKNEIAVMKLEIGADHPVYAEAHTVVKMGFQAAAAITASMLSLEHKATTNTVHADQVRGWDRGDGMHSAVCTALGASKQYEERAMSEASGSRPSTVHTRSRGTAAGIADDGEPFPSPTGSALGSARGISPTLGEVYARDINGGLSPDIHRTGSYKVQVKLHSEVTAENNLEVVSY